jgi:hypothetical protein
MFRRFVAHLAITLTASAAGGATLPKEQPVPSLFPDIVGATWVYQSSEKTEWIKIVTGVEERKDGKVVSVGLVSGWKVPTGRRVLLRKQALYELPMIYEKDAPMLLVKFDGKPGEKWDWESNNPHPQGAGLDHELGEAAEIQDPRGRFSCFPVTTRIRYIDPDFIKKISPTDWYAPGVGQVKSEC